MFKEILQIFSEKIKRNPLSRIEIEGIITKENAPWVRATIVINGKKTTSWFLFDTGASVTVLSPQVSQELGIIFDPLNTVPLNGLVGDPIPCNLVPAEMYFKGESFQLEKPVFVETPVELYIPAPQVLREVDYCLLGRDVINRFGFEIDFGAKRLRLETGNESIKYISVVTSIPTFKQS